MRPYRCLPIDANALAYYRFGERLTWNDQSGNSRNLSLTNSPTFGDFGAVFTKSSTQYAGATGVTFDGVGGNGTLEAWFRLATLPASGDYWGIAGQNYNLRLGVRQHATSGYGLWGSWRQAGDAAINALSYYTTLSTGVWYHAAVSCQRNSAIRLFLNGVQGATNATTDNEFYYSGTDFQVGAMQNVATDYKFDGIIDELLVSKAARYTAAFTPVRLSGGRRGAVRGPELTIMAGAVA